MRGVCTDFPRDDVLGEAFAQLDAAAVLAALKERFDDVPTDARDRWRHIVGVDAAYHPRRHLRLAFALLVDARTPYERFWPEGELIHLHTPIRRPMSRRGRIFRLGSVAFETYRFPDDRRLRGLRRFTSAMDASRQWQKWLDATGGGGIDAESLQRRFIRYVPEEKWIARLRAEVTMAGGCKPVKRRIAVRYCSAAACENFIRRQTAVADALAGSDRARVPELVGAECSTGLAATAWDRGHPLLTVVREEPSAIRGFVEALRDFHSIRVGRLPRVALEHVGRFTRACAEDLALVCEEWADEIVDLGRTLTATLANETADRPVTLHNDLHPRQVLVKGGRFTFLDLERMGEGDAMIDMSNLLAQLSILPHRSEENVSPILADSLKSGLLSAWSDSGGAIREGALAVLTAAAFIKLAHGGMRHLRPGWRAQVRTCLDLAHDELSPRVRLGGALRC